MSDYKSQAEQLLKEWKGDNYIFGVDCLEKTADLAAQYGKKASLVAADWGTPQGEWMREHLNKITGALANKGVDFGVPIRGAMPNAPREDVYRIALSVAKAKPSCIIAAGGGSTIDSCKAASVLNTYPGEDVELYFGTDLVKKAADETGKQPLPVIAVQTAASSGAHLTKYSNLTDPATGIKKLIVDEIIVPPKAVFDYKITLNTPMALTLDGGLDGIAHCWEVFMGATGKVYYEEIKAITIAAVGLIVDALPVIVRDKTNLDARVALGLGTDLGGYAIMISKKNPATGQWEKGGTNGGHLGSFQLIHYLTHGRACALLNPYYTVLFADAIEPQNRVIGAIFQKAGYIPEEVNLDHLGGRRLAETVAGGMIEFSRAIKFPVTLRDAGVPESQIKVMVEASKNPQLKMKLQNMPAPLDVEKGEIDGKMKPTLEAAYTGNLGLIP